MSKQEETENLFNKLKAALKKMDGYMVTREQAANLKQRPPEISPPRWRAIKLQLSQDAIEDFYIG